MIILGLDPGLRNTGYGLIEKSGNSLKFITSGVIHSTDSLTLDKRLLELFNGVTEVIKKYNPNHIAIEETFVNVNPKSTLKLGQARGAVILASAYNGVDVFEYSPNLIKKTVVGVGHADKTQVQMMVKVLLPQSGKQTKDSADALAIAICHAHTYNRKLL
ncbi:MAG: Crossover junction endodeoxyribonuclease RuvC [Alphaproteobacteria bacterium ADurb.Bin438]|nr:MAG: Crossover junction endodeoxyribonuclease RuvC [Alphaproteobacteria bacterium ADurb.Bin438]